MKKKTKQLIVLALFICMITGALIAVDYYSKVPASTLGGTSNKDSDTNPVAEDGEYKPDTQEDTTDKTKEDTKEDTAETKDNSKAIPEAGDDKASSSNADAQKPKSKDGKIWVEAEYKEVQHSEEGHYEKVEVSPAGSVKKEVGQKFICDCGAEFESHASWAAHKEANGG